MNDKPFDFTEQDDIFTTSYEFRIDRSVYNELQFSKSFKKRDKVDSIKAKICAFFSDRKCSRNILLGFIFSVIPVLKWLPKYDVRKDFVKDIAGGLTVGIMQIPQGMAYAMLTSLPPIYGLYVSFVPVIVYFIFGTSRHISLGTFAIICLMNGNVIGTMANNYNPSTADKSIANNTENGTIAQVNGPDIVAYKVQVAVTLSLLVGIMQVGLGVIRLGFLTMYLSDPLISGFTTGAACHILGSQFRHFLGLEVPSGTNSGYFSLFKLFVYFIKHIKEVNLSALTTGIVCAVILYLLKYLNQKYKFKFPIPAELIVVVLGCAISYCADFNRKFNTPTLKTVPKGMPSLTIPSFSIMKDVISQSLVIAIVAFAVNVSLVKSFAKKNKYEIDSNQELIAYGLANAVSSFFSCFPSAVSLSRSVIQEALGSTQVCGFISVLLVLLVLLSIAPLFEPLPNAVLAAIVLVALKGLFKQFIVLKYLWRISKIDAFIWLTSFLAVFCLGVDTGLALGLVINVLSVVARTSKPPLHVLGSVDGTGVYKRMEKYYVKDIPGVKILQFNGSLYFANIEHFLNMVSVHAKICDDTSEVDGNIQGCAMNGIKNNGAIFDYHDMVEKKENGLISSISSAKIKESEFLPTSLSTNSIPESIDLMASRKEETVHSIILDCSLFSFIDSMGVSALGSIVNDYRTSEIEVYLACCSENVISMLNSGGFFALHGKERLFVTVHDAVLHCVSSQTLRSKIYSGNNDEEEGNYKNQSSSFEIAVASGSTPSDSSTLEA